MTSVDGSAKAKVMGRKALDRIATIVMPDTLMRRHRRLIAMKWTCQGKRAGRPRADESDLDP